MDAAQYNLLANAATLLGVACFGLTFIYLYLYWRKESE